MGADPTDRDEIIATVTKVMAELVDALRDEAPTLSVGAAAKLVARHADRTRPVAIRPLASLHAGETAATTRVQWRHGLVSTIDHSDEHVMLRLPDKVMTLPDIVRGRRRGAAHRTCHRRGQPARPRPRRRDGADPQAAAGGGRHTGRRMTAAKRAPCSDQSLARDDPMYGTASAGLHVGAARIARRLGAFGISPVAEHHRPRPRTSIVRRVETAKMRIAAIRRPGRRASRTAMAMVRGAFAVRAARRCTAETVDDPREYLDIALDGSDGDAVDRPCRRGLRARQARPVLRRARTKCMSGDRGTVSRIHLGMFAFGRRPVRRHHARSCPRASATGGSTRPTRRSWFGLPRRPARQQIPARTDVATARRAGRAVLRPRGLRRRPHRQPVTAVGRQGEHRIRVVLRAQLGLRSRSF